MRLYEVNEYLSEVVGLLLEGSPLAIGQTIETPALRAHRYSGSIKVTDMTNAGKRGKMVDSFSLYGLDYVKNQEVLRLFDKFSAQLKTMKSYRSAFTMANGLIKAAERMAGSGFGALEIQTDRDKGVRVRPAGMKKITIDTPYLSGHADGQTFGVRDKKDGFNEPTIMQRGKRSASRFYKWLVKNEKRINSMDFSDVKRALSNAKIDYHYYCAMD